jgi:hypothetical protein
MVKPYLNLTRTVNLIPFWEYILNLKLSKNAESPKVGIKSLMFNILIWRIKFFQ